MVKVIDIIEDNAITGVRYGLRDANEPVSEIHHASAAYKTATRAIKKHKTHTKQKTK